MIQISGSVGKGGQNFRDDVRTVQGLLNKQASAPKPPLVVDGMVGLKTITAIEQYQRKVLGFASPDGRVDPGGKTFQALAGINGPPAPGTPATPAAGPQPAIAWGQSVSTEFKTKVLAICQNLGCDASYLMACMAFESGETFSPSIKNAAGSGAVGLIQFMPSTAKGLGTTTAKLAQMTAEEQLDYVANYFKPYTGKLKTLDDVYMAILWPAGIGKLATYAIFTKLEKDNPKSAYAQNKGLDKDGDGKVTKAEAAGAVRNKLTKGLRPEHIG